MTASKCPSALHRLKGQKVLQAQQSGPLSVTRPVTRLSRVLAVMVMLVAMFVPQLAQAQQVSIIRDAEVEQMIKSFADPLLKAAGLRALPHVFLVADPRFNAFVVEDGSLFINYGTILDIKTPNELKAIIAHEIGHVAGGHLIRLRQRNDFAGRMAVLATVLGVGAAIAAGQSGSSTEMTGLATAFIAASQSATQNSLLAFQRSEESSADAAALKLLARTGQSGKGMLDVMRYLLSRDTATDSPYLRTHPLPADRLDQIEQAARNSKYWTRTDPAGDVAALKLAKAKLSGFLEPQATVLNRYPNTDKSLAARYARVISAYKGGGGSAALPAMSALAKSAPKNPYFWELLGQMYFETGQPGKAVPPLKTALALAPAQTQIRLLYGQALLGTGGTANLNEAVLQLTRAAREEPKTSRTYTDLSRAYAGLGQKGAATLYAAEAAHIRGDEGTALGLARQARGLLPKGSPLWLRANDLLNQ